MSDVTAPPLATLADGGHRPGFDPAQRWDIDWPAVIARRRLVLDHEAVPPYLVLPEVERLLTAARHDVDRLLIDTLWHTGARVSELLALTPRHFITPPGVSGEALVSLATLKRRGRPRKTARAPRRLVPIADAAYLDRLARYCATHRPQRLFAVTRHTVRNRIQRLAAGLELSFRPTPHTFRHAFAVNCVLHGVPLRILQGWLGHADLASTEIYTRVLATETVHFMRRVAFQRADASHAGATLLDSPREPRTITTMTPAEAP